MARKNENPVKILDFIHYFSYTILRFCIAKTKIRHTNRTKIYKDHTFFNGIYLMMLTVALGFNSINFMFNLNERMNDWFKLKFKSMIVNQKYQEQKNHLGKSILIPTEQIQKSNIHIDYFISCIHSHPNPSKLFFSTKVIFLISYHLSAIIRINRYICLKEKKKKFNYTSIVFRWTVTNRNTKKNEFYFSYELEHQFEKRKITR